MLNKFQFTVERTFKYASFGTKVWSGGVKRTKNFRYQFYYKKH